MSSRSKGLPWKFRIFQTEDGDETMFEIRRVYYDENGEFRYWADEPAYPVGENIEELRHELAMFDEAFTYVPVVEEDDKLREVL